MTNFDKAPLSEMQRFRSYSRMNNGQRETWDETCDRTLYSPHLGLKVLGKFSDEEMELIDKYQREKKAFGSMRWLWVGGTEWVEKPEQYCGAFNCTSFRIIDWHSFGMLMDLAMQGSGTGAVLEPDCIDQLPIIENKLELEIIGKFGSLPSYSDTTIELFDANSVQIKVGDSRQGWVSAYESILKIASDEELSHVKPIQVKVDISRVRPTGTPLKGFGGIANPEMLPRMFEQVAKTLNGAVGRKLTAYECCLIIGDAAYAVVAGGIRRSAGMRQGSPNDEQFINSKQNLWVCDAEGNWKIDPERDGLRTANHTVVYHKKPSLEECIKSVTKQFQSGEGAIQWAGEAVARANADLLDTPEKKKRFLQQYEQGLGEAELVSLINYPVTREELNHRMQRYGLNPCGEIIFNDGFCNLSSVHLNQLDPFNFQEQEEAFKASALQAAAFLQRGFVDPRQQASRELDPIVGVSFTGAFTFFTKLFGPDWLKWWEAGRDENWDEASYSTVGDLVTLYPYIDGLYDEFTPDGTLFKLVEESFLVRWKNVVFRTVWDYCDSHGLKRPNRCTTLKPEGSGSLLTGVGCNGHHAPKGWHYIRRMTFAKDDPIALAAIDYGYTVVPSQSDKDENGVLLNDPFDPRCTEWLVEVPVEEEIVHLFPEVADINPGKFSALAQFDWYMQVQQCYVTHNASATLEFTEEEIEPLATRIYEAIQNDEGYISAALLARFEVNETFPRMPFEPVSKAKYDELVKGVMSRRKSDNFQALVEQFTNDMAVEPQDSACGDGLCAIPARTN